MAFRSGGIGVRMNYSGTSSPLGRRLRHISALERREEARAFLRTFASVTNQTMTATERRWAEVSSGLRRRGTYDHTPEELAFGARLAWRNQGRCIGRLFWESLEVFDCRAITDPAAMAERITAHMGYALGDGRIRSVVSIFAPVTGSSLPAYVESEQITQYAGYMLDNGRVIGDRQNVEATRIALSLGWKAPEERGRFDVLPYVIRDRDDRRSLHSVPEALVRHVAISHPDSTALTELGLQWYAVPCVSAMILTIGGIDYPCAPFNGFYMGTEIASRNFVDKKRYDALPQVARALGLNPEAPGTPLWKDVALTELNRAVLHSFKAAGVTIVDHHAAGDQFMEFHQREQAQGRRVAADWRWIVPPQASASSDTFHLQMRNFHPVPNYYRSRSDDGRHLMPFYGDQSQSRLQRARDRLMRRWKLWKRMAW